MSLKFDYVIKNMKKDDLNLAIKWAENEGWNPGVHDASSFYQTDQNGFFMGYLQQKPISCISAVAYDDKFGFLGFYIVKPEFRGKGLGIKIWERGIGYLQDRNIGLDGVIAQQRNYEKYGFKTSHKNIRFAGIVERTHNLSENLCDLRNFSVEKLINYDAKVFSINRSKFLIEWVNQNQSKALGFLSGRDLKGYGVIRPCGIGFKIGPLFAENGQIAQELFQGLVQNLIGKTVFLDVPEPNSHALAFVNKNNMTKVFETVRMYNKYIPNLSTEIFGITTLELG